MESVNRQTTMEVKNAEKPLKKLTWKEKIWLFFQENKLLVLLAAVFLLLVIFYIASKYIHQKISEDTSFTLPTIGATKVSEQGKVAENEKINSIKQRVEDEKTYLKVPEKDYKNYQFSSFFEQNAVAKTDSTPKIVTPNLTVLPTIAPTLTSSIKVNSSRQRGRNKQEKVKISPTKIAELASKNEEFNTTVLTTNVETQGKIDKKEFIKAAIYGTQVIHNNSTVRLRLLENCLINNELLPANALCTGVAMLAGNRLLILVTAIKVHAEYLPVKMVVYDRDMLAGIAYLNDNTKEQITQHSNQSLDNLDNRLYGVGSAAGLAGQIGAGVVSGISHAIRYGAVQKKAGEIELNEGYKVFLKQN